jgi:predicted DNA-binding protein with PD1-like motif
VKAKQLAGDRWALVFDKGDEPVGELERFAREHELAAASFTGIGAFEEVVLGFFDRGRKEYEEIPLREQVEVLSLAGDVAVADGQPKVHAHVVVGKRDGSAHGGHLLRGRVWPTLEVVLTASAAELRKSHDPETGLALIDLS